MGALPPADLPIKDSASGPHVTFFDAYNNRIRSTFGPHKEIYCPLLVPWPLPHVSLLQL